MILERMEVGMAGVRLIVLVSVAGCAVLGCHASGKIGTSADAAKNLNEAQVRCPEYYRLGNPEEVASKDDHWLASPDGIVCSDGRPYCFAKGQEPVLIPEYSEDWECQDIEIDNPEDSGERVEEAYPFCGRAEEKRRIKAIRHKERMRAWICVSEMCFCGDEPCAEGNRCHDGVCSRCRDGVCDPETEGLTYEAMYIQDGALDEDAEDSQGEEGAESSQEKPANACDNMETSHDTYYPEFKGDPADDRSSYVDYVRTYPCGDAWLKSYSNRYCLAHPAGDMVMHSICPALPGQKAVGAIDDVHIDAENQVISMDMDDDALETMRRKPLKFAQPDRDTCACGEEWCASDTACWKKHCVDIATLEGLPSKDYHWNQGRPYCAAASCTCGENKCPQGEWCIEGRCFDTPDVMKIEDKYIKYGLYVNTIIEHYYVDEEKYEALPRDHFAPLDEIAWLDIVVNQSSAQCEESAMLENVEDYICVIDKVDNACAEGATDTYAFRGYHCMKDDGCACGDTKCDKFARCYEGQCLYDEIYTAMACATDYDLWGFGEGKVAVDERGWCVCGASHTPPNMPGFDCEPYAGMECRRHGGCDCGGETCAYGDYCAKPGKCVDSLWDLQNDAEAEEDAQ